MKETVCHKKRQEITVLKRNKQVSPPNQIWYLTGIIREIILVTIINIDKLRQHEGQIGMEVERWKL
jgi:hypothetical protein